MDFQAIFSSLQGLNFFQIIGGIFAGVLITKLLDEIILQILSKYWPEKYVAIFLSWVRQFDDNCIDPLKEKYPKAAAKLEENIAGVLTQAIDIIEDK